eukprot:3132030-Prymnesium_polylepis.1
MAPCEERQPAPRELDTRYTLHQEAAERHPRPLVTTLLLLVALGSIAGWQGRRGGALDAPDEAFAQGLGSVFDAALDEPPQPEWPAGVANLWLDPSQEEVDALYDSLRRESGEYTSARAAILLTRAHRVSRLGVGFFTTVAGVETGVAVDSLEAIDLDGEWLYGPQVSTHGFWRSLEGVEVRRDAVWSMSQAAPIRRCRFAGDLALRDAGQYVSGGFISNTIVEGVLRFDGQQQYLARNCDLRRGYTESSLNIVLVGCTGQGLPPHAPAAGTSEAVTAVEHTPRIAEKPYLEYARRSGGDSDGGDGGGDGGGGDGDGDGGDWTIVVPAFGEAVSGPQDTARDARRIPFWRGGWRAVLVLEPSHSEEELHAAFGHPRCEAVVIAPGIYRLSRPLRITRRGFVVLGLGLATLVCAGRGGCLAVDDAIDDVRIAGLLLEAGVMDLSRPTAPLLQWGTRADAATNGMLSDVHARLTAMPTVDTRAPATAPLAYAVPVVLPAAGCAPKRADVMVMIASSGVTVDHTWLWHADHDQCANGNASECSLPYLGTCVTDASVSAHGLVVEGHSVQAYGLQIEHQKSTLALWKGRSGSVYMFQAELPYTSPAFSLDQVGYYVAPGALPHTAVGIGVYVIFEGCRGQVAMQLPHGTELDGALIMQIQGRPDAFRALVCSSDTPHVCACTAERTACPPQASVSPIRMRRLAW